MSQYKVINQRVEINGLTREIGTVLDESAFRPSSGVQVPVIDKVTGLPTGETAPELSELESLLATEHVALVQ